MELSDEFAELVSPIRKPRRWTRCSSTARAQPALRKGFPRGAGRRGGGDPAEALRRLRSLSGCESTTSEVWPAGARGSSGRVDVPSYRFSILTLNPTVSLNSTSAQSNSEAHLPPAGIRKLTSLDSGGESAFETYHTRGMPSTIGYRILRSAEVVARFGGHSHEIHQRSWSRYGPRPGRTRWRRRTRAQRRGLKNLRAGALLRATQDELAATSTSRHPGSVLGTRGRLRRGCRARQIAVPRGSAGGPSPRDRAFRLTSAVGLSDDLMDLQEGRPVDKDGPPSSAAVWLEAGPSRSWT